MCSAPLTRTSLKEVMEAGMGFNSKLCKRDKVHLRKCHGQNSFLASGFVNFPLTVSFFSDFRLQDGYEMKH